MHNKYFITKPTKLYCIKDFNLGSYLYFKNNIYTVSIFSDNNWRNSSNYPPDLHRYYSEDNDDVYFIINNNTDNPLIFAKTSLYNKNILKDFFINIKEERKEKLEKLKNYETNL